MIDKEKIVYLIQLARGQEGRKGATVELARGLTQDIHMAVLHVFVNAGAGSTDARDYERCEVFASSFVDKIMGRLEGLSEQTMKEIDEEIEIGEERLLGWKLKRELIRAVHGR